MSSSTVHWLRSLVLVALLGPCPVAGAGTIYTWASSGWGVEYAGDSFPAGPVIPGIGYAGPWLGIYPDASGTSKQVTTSLSLPAGIGGFWFDSPPAALSYVDWNGASKALTFKTTGPVPSESYASADVDSGLTGSHTPAVSFTRDASTKTFAAGVATQTITVNLTMMVQSSLAGYNTVEVTPFSDDMPDGYTCDVWSISCPAGFTDQGHGWFSADNPGGLVLGATYRFSAQGIVTRSSPSAAAFFVPESRVQYCNATNYNGTGSLTMDLGGGVSATVIGDPGASISGQGRTNGNDLVLSRISTGIGPATPTSVMLVRGQEKSVSGNMTYIFHFGAPGNNIVSGTLTPPGSATSYQMPTDEDGASLDLESANPSDLAAFGAGVYRFDLAGSDGLVRTFTVSLAAGSCPAAFPQIDQAMGFHTYDKRPGISWAAPSDPNVNLTGVQLATGTYDPGLPVFVGTSQTSFKIPEDQLLGGGTGDVFFGNLAQGHDGQQGFDYLTGWATGSAIYFNRDLPADANHDSFVDMADYSTWFSHYAHSGVGWAEADFDCDGDVDMKDYTTWFSTYGLHGDAQGAVPEPAALSLLAMGGLALIRRRNK